MSTTRPVAIVTAAGRGIGAACARALAARGYALALMSPSGAAEALAAELGGRGMTGSVTVPDDLRQLVDDTWTAHGRIDAVINNTGHAAKGTLLDIADDDWHAGLDMLLLNVIRTARMVAPRMAEGGGGAIVNISSFAAKRPECFFNLLFPVLWVIHQVVPGSRVRLTDEEEGARVAFAGTGPGKQQ